MALGTEDGIALTELGRSRTSGYGDVGGSHLSRRQSRRGDGTLGQDFSLPQADGGRDAWLFLAGCFSIEALVWGEWSLFSTSPMQLQSAFGFLQPWISWCWNCRRGRSALRASEERVEV